jgi:hypothetical protein
MRPTNSSSSGLIGASLVAASFFNHQACIIVRPCDRWQIGLIAKWDCSSALLVRTKRPFKLTPGTACTVGSPINMFRSILDGMHSFVRGG